MQLHQAKADARRRMRAMRKARTRQRRLQDSAAIVQHLLAAPCVQQARVVGVYWALPNEIILIPGLSAPVLALPVMQGRGLPLVFRRFQGTDTLVAASFGVQEPSGMCAEVPVSDIDVLVMPGLAVDPKGNRLGYGGGYYDRTLVGLKDGAVTVMVSLDEQVIDSVPADPTDVAVQAVVTPTGWKWLG